MGLHRGSLLVACACFAVPLLAVPLPSGTVITAYETWGGCHREQILRACREGVNVMIWFSLTLVNNNSSPSFVGGPDMDCVANVSATLVQEGLPTTHLMSFGGWDAAHPDTTFDGPTWYAAWQKWNSEVAARPALGFHGFDGFDWDIEGTDDRTSGAPSSTVTLALLHLVGTMSTLARADGQAVSLTPCQSYLDPGSSAFDLNLNHQPAWIPSTLLSFPYHGANALAYLVAAYPAAFDLVQIMLYESWSLSNYMINTVKVPPAAYIEGWFRQLVFGWYVYFGYVPGYVDIASQWVRLNSTQIVVGLANAWTPTMLAPPPVGANQSRQAVLLPSELATAHAALGANNGTTPRGYMFWDIIDEGKPIVLANGSKRPLWLAKELNAFLHVR